MPYSLGANDDVWDLFRTTLESLTSFEIAKERHI